MRSSFVQQIEPAKDAMRMEEVDKLVLSSLTQELTIAEMTVPLEKQKRLPKDILSDHDGQFKEQWKEWCRVEVYFARPSHPQDKVEVERRVQNLNGEFIDHLGKFPEWLKGTLGECKEWFNHSRFRRGIKAHPANLYKCNVRNLT